ncbi:metallophosphoesterase [Undibacterium terreum]|uniref:Serine/threonine protein phosphatase n=1 Tax=Undibacterium terreum TaxID=1224302 RepID=A0A916UCY2_9BURK|nr:metallophosphoesterase [Undibacterium terreum]GGC69161.1 serine/threonine protein phosphatase [Undibacterium terreum]
MQQKSAKHIARRDFLKMAGIGGVVFASGLAGGRNALAAYQDDFYFVQLSDTHWGFEGAPNPDAKGTLPKAVAAVNSLAEQPDFIVFTGDLTHTTDDPVERRKRMQEFREMTSQLKVKKLYFMPGEHDASLDNGAAFQEFFGKTHYRFAHKGVNFIVVDNVSDPTASIGEAQLQWLKDELATLDKKQRLVVFTHRPLFDLAPQWDWATRDGAKAVELLMPFQNVTVFYGHIHQEHHHMTAHIPHHAAKSLIFPLPAPGSVPKRVPLAWDPAHPYQGLGFRDIEAEAAKPALEITELPVIKA